MAAGGVTNTYGEVLMSGDSSSVRRCANEMCGVEFEVNRIGRPRIYCTRGCGKQWSNRRYRLAHRGELLEANRLWREQNAARHRQNSRDWYANNRERSKAKSRRWEAENLERSRALHAKKTRKRRARMRGNLSVPYTVDELASRLSMWPGCWLCGASDVPLEADHVKPVSKGGPDCLSNLRPACRPCNASKADRWPLERLRWAV